MAHLSGTSRKGFRGLPLLDVLFPCMSMRTRLGSVELAEGWKFHHVGSLVVFWGHTPFQKTLGSHHFFSGVWWISTNRYFTGRLPLATDQFD